MSIGGIEIEIGIVGGGGEGDLRIPWDENPWRWKAEKYPFCWDIEHLS